MEKLFLNYYETAAIVLFGVGFVTLLLNNNLIKKIIGLNIMDTAVFLFFIAKGYI
ncbi:NADH-quinone oxidoreductase subunit K, partial [Clostridium cochlearium]